MPLSTSYPRCYGCGGTNVSLRTVLTQCCYECHDCTLTTPEAATPEEALKAFTYGPAWLQKRLQHIALRTSQKDLEALVDAAERSSEGGTLERFSVDPEASQVLVEIGALCLAFEKSAWSDLFNLVSFKEHYQHLVDRYQSAVALAWQLFLSNSQETEPYAPYREVYVVHHVNGEARYYLNPERARSQLPRHGGGIKVRLYRVLPDGTLAVGPKVIGE